jgi:hypothetical protein
MRPSSPPAGAYSLLKKTRPSIAWPATRKDFAKKPGRMMKRPSHYVSPALANAGGHVKPLRPIKSLRAEMWEDYRAFKAAGMLAAWRKKWAAYLPK